MALIGPDVLHDPAGPVLHAGARPKLVPPFPAACTGFLEQVLGCLFPVGGTPVQATGTSLELGRDRCQLRREGVVVDLVTPRRFLIGFRRWGALLAHCPLDVGTQAHCALAD